MKWSKALLVVCGALIVTALGIDAADTFSGIKSTLLASIISGGQLLECPVGMVVLSMESHRICVDVYEASVGDVCPIAEPASIKQTTENMESVGCMPVSVVGVKPWRFVTHRQAEQLCARAGKRLLGSGEWYQSALGTVDTQSACAVSKQLQLTGAELDCRSGIGSFDMIGNVWELVSGEVINGFYNDTPLPLSGYVSGINDTGMPIRTATSAESLYGSDYFWVETPGNFAIMRGGFYGSGSDGGLYSVQAAISDDFGSGAMGFRCARSL